MTKLQALPHREERSEATELRSGGIVLADALELASRRWLVLTIGAALGIVVALGVLSSKDATYRAEATLRLEQQSSSSSILSDLAALTQAPLAISEMEILRSRTIAETVVAQPDGGLTALATPDGAGTHLGLGTIVDDEGLRPGSRLTRLIGLGAPEPESAAPRLFAEIVPDDPAVEAPVLLVEFSAVDHVVVQRFGALGASDAIEARLTPDIAIRAHGVALTLLPTGDLTGRSFRVLYQSPADAVERVLKATRVAETDRNSGVIRVVYQDSDPVRAAETINALCRNYLARNQASSERRASQTVEFIDGQLGEQTELLANAEADVVRHKQASPRFVDLGAAAKALIEKMTVVEVGGADARIQRAALDEALAHIDAGDLAALSRFGPEVADPVTASLIASIAQLTAERELLERSDTGAFKTLLQQQLIVLSTGRDSELLRLQTLRSIHERLEAGDATVLGGLVTTTEVGMADPMLTAYVERWTELDAGVRTLELEFTDDLPELRNQRSEREAVQARIVVILGGRIAGIEARVAAYDALTDARTGSIDALPGEERARIGSAIESLRIRTIAQLRGRIAGFDGLSASLAREAAALEAQLASLPESERELAAPMRAVATHGEIVKLLLLRKQEAEITRAATIATAEFIDAAVPPRKPIAPSLLVHSLMGLLLGLAAAATFAVVREGRGSEIHTAAELEHATGLPVVGTIPDFRRGRTRVKDATEHFVALRDDPEGPIAEAYRALRSNLKFIIGSSQDRKTLAITSCVPGEGKSVTNVDVALSFAMAGKRVLLVDADMRRPSVSKYLRICPGIGLSDVLRRTHKWQECLVQTFHENLEVLPSGDVPESPGDLLAGAHSRELIAELREAYDLVIFDVPPVLAVADIECLAPHLDAVLLLCRSSKLMDTAVTHAVTRLRQVGTNLVGAVLNAVVARGVTSGDYGYGYGYGTDGTRKGRRAARSA